MKRFEYKANHAVEFLEKPYQTNQVLPAYGILTKATIVKTKKGNQDLSRPEAS